MVKTQKEQVKEQNFHAKLVNVPASWNERCALSLPDEL
jgi:hypothetical protein